MAKNRFLSNIPPVTRHLLILNVAIWIISSVFNMQGVDISKYLGLHYFGAPDFNLAQPVTYMFMHDYFPGIGHIFFNMFSLYMFGCVLERALGMKRFLFYYLATGIGAALVQEAVLYYELYPVISSGYQMVNLNGEMLLTLPEYLNLPVTVGASGAVFGVLLAFGMLFPNVPLYLFFVPVPIKAKYMVVGYGLLELAFGISGTMSGVAHFAHLGGLLFGLLIILVWKKKGVIGGGYN